MNKIEFTEFVNTILDDVNIYAKKSDLNIKATLKTTTKNNEVQLTGIEIDDGSDIRPVIYLEKFYEEYCEFNKDFEEIVEELFRIYDTNKLKIDTKDLLSSWKNIKDDIYPILVNLEMNDLDERKIAYTCLAASCDPEKGEFECEECKTNYRRVFAVIYKYVIPSVTDGQAAITITENILKKLDVSIETLHEKAIDNLRARSSYVMAPIEDIISSMLGKETPKNEVEKINMTVIHDPTRPYGAVYIALQEVLQKIKDMYTNGAILIPSSVHEWIAMPDPHDEKDYENIKEIIKGVNDTMVDKQEILSYDLFKISADGTLMVI